MAEVIFNYQRNEIKVQCKISDKMKILIYIILASIKNDKNVLNLFYLYNETSIIYEITFWEQPNKFDKSILSLFLFFYF